MPKRLWKQAGWVKSGLPEAYAYGVMIMRQHSRYSPAISVSFLFDATGPYVACKTLESS
jgi:hypothetical protein